MYIQRLLFKVTSFVAALDSESMRYTWKELIIVCNIELRNGFIGVSLHLGNKDRVMFGSQDLSWHANVINLFLCQ